MVRENQHDKVIQVDDELVETMNPHELDQVNDMSQLRYLNETSLVHLIKTRGIETHTNDTYIAGANHILSLDLPERSANPNKPVLSEEQIKLETNTNTQAWVKNFFNKLSLQHNDNKASAIVFPGAECPERSRKIVTTMSEILNNSIKSPHSSNLHNASNHSSSTNTLNKELLNKKKILLSAYKMLSLLSTTIDQKESRAIRTWSFVLNSSKTHINHVSVHTSFIDLNYAAAGFLNHDYEIFEKLLSGNENSQLRKELYLPVKKSGSAETQSPPLEEGQLDPGHQLLFEIFENLQISEDIYKPLLISLATIYHLRVAGAKQFGKRWVFNKPESAHKACALMGVTTEDLTKSIFEPDSNSHSHFNGSDNLYAFIAGFYGEIHQKFMLIINDLLSKIFKPNNSNPAQFYIDVYDTPGYKHQSPNLTLNDLIMNYINDKINRSVLEQTVYKHRELLQEEDILIELEYMDKELIHHTIKAIDIPNETVNSPPNGLFAQLEYASLLASSVGGNVDGFQVQPHVLIQRIINADICKNKPQSLNSSTQPGCLKVGHGANGSWPLEYNISNWSKNARINPMTYNGWRIFTNSRKTAVERLFRLTGTLSSSERQSQSTAIGGMTLAKRTMTRSKALRKNSALAAAQHAGQNIEDTLSASNIYTCVVISSNDKYSQSSNSSVSNTQTSSINNNLSLNIPWIRKQIHSLMLLQMTKTYKQGYPDHMLKLEFLKRYTAALDTDNKQTFQLTTDELKHLKIVLEQFDINSMKYKLGRNRILFRSGILEDLEHKRSNFVGKFIIKFQASARGYLIRKNLDKMKVENIAAKTVQRNLRAYMELKKWPWWKLYCQLLPLVEANKSDIEIRALQVSILVLTRI